jgi:hypothetical protein
LSDVGAPTSQDVDPEAKIHVKVDVDGKTPMTTKQKILSVIQSLEDDTSIEQAIDRLYLLRKVEIGLQQAENGDVVEHDDFMNQLDCDEPS